MYYTSDAGTMLGKYDAQDRLVEYGNGSTSTTFNYDFSGRLIAKTAPNGDVTSYTYNYQGYLEDVLCMNAGTTVTHIQYENDLLGRRILRKEEIGQAMVVTNRWLYGGFLSPIAELDSEGDVKFQYIYGTRSNVPDYIIDHSDSGKKYRVITSHLGSVIRVVNAQSGVTTQSIVNGGGKVYQMAE